MKKSIIAVSCLLIIFSCNSNSSNKSDENKFVYSVCKKLPVVPSTVHITESEYKELTEYLVKEKGYRLVDCND